MNTLYILQATESWAGHSNEAMNTLYVLQATESWAGHSNETMNTLYILQATESWAGHSNEAMNTLYLQPNTILSNNRQHWIAMYPIHYHTPPQQCSKEVVDECMCVL